MIRGWKTVQQRHESDTKESKEGQICQGRDDYTTIRRAWSVNAIRKEELQHRSPEESFKKCLNN